MQRSVQDPEAPLYGCGCSRWLSHR